MDMEQITSLAKSVLEKNKQDTSLAMQGNKLKKLSLFKLLKRKAERAYISASDAELYSVLDKLVGN